MQKKEVYYSDSTFAQILFAFLGIIMVVASLVASGWIYYNERMYLYDLRAPFSPTAVMIHTAIPIFIIVGKYMVMYLAEVVREGEDIHH